MTRHAKTSRTRRLLGGLLAGLLLAGCATPPRPAGGYGPSTAGPVQPDPATTVLNVIATPLYFVFKLAVCAATVVLAAPATALAGITDPYGAGWKRADIADGFASNCGPPYSLF